MPTRAIYLDKNRKIICRESLEKLRHFALEFELKVYYRWLSPPLAAGECGEHTSRDWAGRVSPALTGAPFARERAAAHPRQRCTQTDFLRSYHVPHVSDNQRGGKIKMRRWQQRICQYCDDENNTQIGPIFKLHAYNSFTFNNLKLLLCYPLFFTYRNTLTFSIFKWLAYRTLKHITLSSSVNPNTFVDGEAAA